MRDGGAIRNRNHEPRQQALVVPDKATRVAQFHCSTLHALQELVQAAGLRHPKDITAHHIVRRISDTEVRLLSNLITRMQPGALRPARRAAQRSPPVPASTSAHSSAGQRACTGTLHPTMSSWCTPAAGHRSGREVGDAAV